MAHHYHIMYALWRGVLLDVHIVQLPKNIGAGCKRRERRMGCNTFRDSKAFLIDNNNLHLLQHKLASVRSEVLGFGATIDSDP